MQTSTYIYIYIYLAQSTTMVFPTGNTQNLSSSISNFFLAIAKSTGGLLSIAQISAYSLSWCDHVQASSLISQVPQCTPTLFFACSCDAIRTAPSGSVCWRCMCHRGS